MDPLVLPQCSRSGEAFAADGAAVRFVAGVAPHVRIDVLKTLPTDVTLPASLFVRLQVSQQTVRRVELLSTNATHVGVVAVCLCVSPQEAPTVKEIITDFAAERALLTQG